MISPREEEICRLLLAGCDNHEIAKRTNMAYRTVKAHFNRLFLRYGIQGGVKRVKLVNILYKEYPQWRDTAIGPLQVEKDRSSDLLPAV